MKKMLRHEVIDYGFNARPKDDVRLQVEGEDFNDFHYGSGWNRKEAIQFAIELIEEKSGVQASKELVKEMESASTEEMGEGTEAVAYSLAIRFFYDRKEEDAEMEANLLKLIEERRLQRQAEAVQNGEVEELVGVSHGL